MDELLIAADQACYAAKDKGRNRVEVFHQDDDYYRKQRAQFLSVSEITRALQEQRLILYQQRIQPLRPDLREHIEVLVRLIDDKGAIIQPSAFIPAAERFNLMPKVDHWVIEQVCRMLGAHGPERDGGAIYAVNLSGTTLSKEDLGQFVGDCFARHAVDPSRVCFEITETAAIGSLDKVQQFIDEIHVMGATVALDDFGSGLSSFAYLRRLNVDFLKIDALFVRNLDSDARDRAVVRSIMEVAHVHGMLTIAEFVHKPEIADLLTEMGIDYGQGYALHRPELLRTH
jgi:EAL domain-containing protein (putative c-di-GMP-specific phosphodiesterase class I)